MSSFDPSAAWAGQAVRSWSEINAELRALEGKNDAESNARRADLIDNLMCADMNLGPMRKAIAEARSSERGRITTELRPNQSPDRRPTLAEILEARGHKRGGLPKGGGVIITGIKPPTADGKQERDKSIGPSSEPADDAK